ncbi:MAG: hypothetical protein AAGA48_40325, partial [Myxococcota bacterium]
SGGGMPVGPRSDVVGSVALVQSPASFTFPEGIDIGVGVTLSQDGGVINIASCAFIGYSCTTEYPGIGEDVPALLDLSAVGQPQFFDAGAMEAAGNLMPFDSTNQLNLRAGVNLTGPGNFSVGGDLVPFDSADAFPVVGEFELTSHDGAVPVRITPDDKALTLTWTSKGEGMMILTADDTLFGLDPAAGTFDLTAESFDFDEPLDTRAITLSLLTHTEVNAEGNIFQIETRRTEYLQVDYIGKAAGEELLNFADNCDDAKALDPLTDGRYYGTLANNTNAHEPDVTATDEVPALGRDAVMRLDVTAGQVVEVSYQDLVYDGAIYLLDSDCDVNNPLEIGNGTGPEYGGEESIEFTVSEDATYYILVDNWSGDGAEVGGLFEFEVDFD